MNILELITLIVIILISMLIAWIWVGGLSNNETDKFHKELKGGKDETDRNKDKVE